MVNSDNAYSHRTIVKCILENLHAAYKDGPNMKACEQMAIEAGIAINNASVTIVYGMSRPIGDFPRAARHLKRNAFA